MTETQTAVTWSDLRRVRASSLTAGDRFYRPAAFEAYGLDSQTGRVSGLTGPHMSGRVVVVDRVDNDGKMHAHSEDGTLSGSQHVGELSVLLVTVPA